MTCTHIPWSNYRGWSWPSRMVDVTSVVKLALALCKIPEDVKINRGTKDRLPLIASYLVEELLISASSMP